MWFISQIPENKEILPDYITVEKISENVNDDFTQYIIIYRDIK